MSERHQVDVKRFYIPPFDWICPVCGAAHRFDYYISYPHLDEPEKIYGCCEHDDMPEEEDWEGIIAYATVRLDIKMEKLNA